MGKRLKSIEDTLADEKKRQQANLKAQIKARQKKGVRNKVKDMDKDIDSIEDEIEKLKDQVDKEKALAYAEEGNVGLVDEQVAKRKEKISSAIGALYNGFENQLTQQEQEDIEIQ